MSVSHTPSRRHVLLACLFLSSVIFALYSSAFGHNFMFDEESIITRNPFIKDLSLIPEIFKHGYFNHPGRAQALWIQYYRPLTSVTFAWDYHFWKLNPLGYNLTNTLLHTFVCLLLTAFLNKIFHSFLPAFLSSLLYAVSTIHTEAVTYIASRGDLLGNIFLLLSLLSYWKSTEHRPNALFWSLSILSYLLGLFSKESLLLLPLYLVLLNICFIKQDFKTTASKLFPFIIVAVLFVLYRKYYSPVPLGPPSLNMGEALLRFLSMGPSFLSYLQALILPEAFKFGLGVRFAERFLDLKVLTTLFIYLILISSLLLSFKKKGPVFFGLSLFLIGLLPYSQIIHYHPFWSEHYLYLPTVGLSVILGSLIQNVSRIPQKKVVGFFLIVYAAFFFFLSLRTWQRNTAYTHTEKYYELLAKSDSPYAYLGFQNMARVEIEKGHWEKALVPLKTSAAIQPHFPSTENLLGLYYLQKHLPQKALEHFLEAHAYGLGDHTYLINAGITLSQMGRYDKAAQIFEQIQKEAPRFGASYRNLVVVYDLMGEPQKARQWGERGLELLNLDNTEYLRLSLSMIQLAYRHGWDDLARTQADKILKQFPDTYWYSDVAGLLAGKLTEEEFTRNVRSKYQGMNATIPIYVLISYVLQQRWDNLSEFIENHHDELAKLKTVHPLTHKEIERAEQMVKDHHPS